MAQTIALIHTSPTLTPIFGALCAKQMPDVTVFHMVDESLIKDTIHTGHVRKVTTRRLLAMVESAFAAGADAALITCSTLGPSVTLVQEMFDSPVLRVDEAMAEAAVKTGDRIGVLATLHTTLEPTLALLRNKAAQMGRKVTLVENLCSGAFDAVLSGDTATHDRIVSAALLEQMRHVDVIVLAQASMARVVSAMPPGSMNVPVLSSPALSVQRAHEVLQNMSGVTA